MNEHTYSPYGESPSLVKTIAVLTLINGIVNIFWGLIATAVVVPTIILTCLAVFTILPTILGIFEIIYALKLLNTPPQPVQPSTAIAILEILCVLTGNVFSMIVGILALVFYSDAQVKSYFTRLNGIPYPVAPAVPVPPAPPAAPLPGSSPQGDPALELESPMEAAPESPVEPKKPRTRKVAAENTNPEPGVDMDPSA
jgi:hypothetical protein